MNTKVKTTESNIYKSLLNHCKKQYNDIKTITKAYLKENKVFAIEYIRTDGIKSIPSNIIDCDNIIYFN